MNERTRQLILLIGVLTFLTSSLVVINYSRANSDDSDKNKGMINNNNTVKPGKISNKTNSSNQSEPKGIIGKSIRGFQLMINDIKTATGAISGNAPKTP